MAVYIELAQGDTLVIGNSRIRLERKSGQRARLAIDSAEDVERVKAGDDVPSMKPPTSTAPTAPKSMSQPVLRRPEPAAT